MSPTSLNDNLHLVRGEECSSGRASRRSHYAQNTTKHWQNEKYKRNISPYKSKWAKRKAKRIERKKVKSFHGYKKEKVESEWIKCSCSQGGEMKEGGKHTKKEIVLGWKHPIHNYQIWDDHKPEPVTGYRWVSTAKPSNDEWVQRTYPKDKDGNSATTMGLMSNRGSYQYDYIPPPEPVKKKSN